MTRYEFLLAKKESGELNEWFAYGVSPHLLSWMEIYAYYLEHMADSYAEISYHMKNATKTTVFRAITFLNQPHT